MKVVSLKRKKDFDTVFHKKKTFGNRHYTFYYCKNGLSFNRLGIIVSKKISKKAVCRNRIRRQVHEAYRLLQPEIKSGYDFIVIAKNKCLDEAYGPLSRSLDHVFYKTHLKRDGVKDEMV
jgi:ribonuclease P protein component